MKPPMDAQLEARLASSIEASAGLILSTKESLAKAVVKGAEMLVQTFSQGGKALICGNGGSAAQAQHLAAELVGRYQKERLGLRALCLASDTALLTALGNDYGFDEIFARQVAALGKEGDCLVALTTSGRSRNIARAMEEAQAKGLLVLAFTGKDGGEALKLLRPQDASIHIPHDSTPRIQEAHLCALHLLCEALEELLS